MTDRLTLAHALEEGGMPREAAEHVATEIFEAIRENVATKTDLREMELRLDVRFANVNTRFEQVETKIGEVKTELLRWMFAQTFVILAVVAALHFAK